LKNYNFIERHFEQVYEDQFDFHLYAIRKFTLEAYEEMLEMEDKLYQNPFAIKTCIGIIQCMNKLQKNKE